MAQKEEGWASVVVWLCRRRRVDMERADALKVSGNELFAAKDWSGAEEKYTAAIEQWKEWKTRESAANESETLTEEEVEAKKAIKAQWDAQASVYYKNRAACAMEQGALKEAVSDCSEALQLCPGDLKATYRRADAYEKLHTLPGQNDSDEPSLDKEMLGRVRDTQASVDASSGVDHAV